MFLKRLYKEWRLLFWVLIGFMLAQVFFMAKGIQNVPVFLYNMYSTVHQPMDSFPVILIKKNGGYVNHKQLSGREQEMLLNSVSFYLNLKRTGDSGMLQSVDDRFNRFSSSKTLNYLHRHLVNDGTSLSTFADWWQRYYQAITGDKQPVTVVRSYVYFKAPYTKSTSDSVIFSTKPN